ncbi:hypothetical protein R1flu_008971 [Riccia fluitans]|uniref:Oil body-associated protein 2A n=1 Tax=Riccia fluitans TaxID=41844 RepID=A0ABD1Z0R1_9MARC
MSSSDISPGQAIPSTPEDVPGGRKSASSHILGTGAGMIQSFKPINNFQQHVCTWAIFSHDMKRQIETHHYCSRLNEDFLQCLVYDTDRADGRLIGVEYIISERLFLGLPDEEKKLWHSHFYEIKNGLWVNPGVPEIVQKLELKQLANTYGKFWCTWQFDRGDRLPLGPPALMMSPQAQAPGQIRPELIKERDEKYHISTSEKAESRKDIQGPELIHPLSDLWKTTGKGWAVDLKEVDMILRAGTPLADMDRNTNVDTTEDSKGDESRL